MSPEQVTVRLAALVTSVGNLNPDVAEIGAGRLATLHSNARDVAPYMGRLAEVVADGLLLREMAALMMPANHERWATAVDVLQGLIDADDPKDTAQYIAHLRATVQQVNRIHPS